MDDLQVLVQAHATDEKDATVKASGIESANHFAQEIPKDPMPGHRDGPEGQCHHKQEVGDGQVQQIDLSHPPGRHVTQQDHQKEEVPAQPQHKEQAVEGRQEDLAEGQHGVFPAQHEGHLIQVVIVVEAAAVLSTVTLRGKWPRGGSGGHVRKMHLVLDFCRGIRGKTGSHFIVSTAMDVQDTLPADSSTCSLTGALGQPALPLHSCVTLSK